MGPLLCALTFIGFASAQAQGEFVASIKPAAPDAPGMFIRRNPGGGMTITNMTLKDMIVMAWRIQPFEIVGGPPWMGSARYAVVAKAAIQTAPSAISVMLQFLLKDRFQLATHRETRELPVYALVMARKDGALGPKLMESKEGSCSPVDPSNPPAMPKGEAPTLRCGGIMAGVRSFTGVSITVATLGSSLSRLLGRIVIDKTALAGKFDINLQWVPDESQSIQPAHDSFPEVAGPSIFTALQEQLGLKLESQKGPVEVLVIDHAGKPSED
jgi:uncharacterized protein (TIGR03435 family)